MPDDLGLLCPRCDYNLTGLIEARCPECGTPFDRQAMLEQIDGLLPGPIPGWDDSADRTTDWQRYWSTFFRSLFHPLAFAEEFPILWSRESVRRYMLCSTIVLSLELLAIAVIQAVIGWFLDSELLLLSSPLLILAIPPILLAGLLSKALVAALFETLAEPRILPRKSNNQRITSAWMDFLPFYDSLYIASLPVLAVTLWFVWGIGGLKPDLPIVCLGLFMLWCGVVFLAFMVRAESTPRRWVAFFLILPVAGFGVFAGVILGMAVSLTFSIPFIATCNAYHK